MDGSIFTAVPNRRHALVSFSGHSVKEPVPVFEIDEAVVAFELTPLEQYV